ncbi:MAG TPA: lysylphosphatidylglycerol synthase transmembrane domain-containing protein [Gemmatimonadales bacterium]|nr:lysylphosphatidylglycerol synthase transmembrane domain-containing protein [Gemmatimonadales bacterium]
MTPERMIPERTPAKRARWLRPVLGLVVAGLFVWLIARRVEWAAVSRVLSSASAAPLALGLLFFAAGIGVRVLRWWWMLRGFEPDLAARRCARPFLVGLAVNNTVPFRAGDLVRAFGFRHALRSPPGRVLGTLVIERVLDGVVLIAIFFIGLLGAASGVVPAAYVSAGATAGAIGLAAIVTLVVAPGWVARRLERARSRLEARAGGGLVARVAGGATHFVEALGTLQSPARAVQLLGLSALAWTLEGGLYAAVAASLHATVAPLAPWFSLATGTLATLLPSSPGYVGTFDYFTMLGLTAYGADRSVAAAFALLTHVLLWLPITAAGALLLLAPRITAMRREAEPA